METIEVIASGFVDDDHILDTDSTDGFAIQTGFDRNDITGDKFGAAQSQQRWLVNFEAQAVTCTVSHAGKGIGCIVCR